MQDNDNKNNVSLKDTNQINFKNIRIGSLLISQGLITDEQLDYALKIQKQRGKKIGDTLVDLGFVKDEDLTKILSDHLKIEYIEISKLTIKNNALDLIKRSYAEENRIVPLEIKDKLLIVATSNPMNFYLLDEIRLKVGMDVKFVLATIGDIDRAISQYYINDSASEIREDLNEYLSPSNFVTNNLNEKLKEEIENSPIVKFVKTVIETSITENASDIHIEPLKDVTRIRFRIDGQLIEKMIIKAEGHSNLVTRIKIMSSMDIAEKRLSQDGRIEIEMENRIIDLRVSTLPTVFGEKIVIRILNGLGNILSINQLGFSEKNLSFFRKIIKAPNGILLLSGPTGSGKTTTLYSILNEINDSSVNVVTVEDPVEYKIDKVSQVQVNNKAGRTFSGVLRSILRQDPDIIMIGEIRDDETAEIAVKAAITGHLVLSTIHTNSSISTIVRLLDMGIENYLLSSAIVGIVAQRLVKRLCPSCKFEYTSDKDEMDCLGVNEAIRIFKAIGCPDCNETGYRGRLAIHEVLSITPSIKNLINQNAMESEIEAQARKEGMIFLREDGIEYVKKGLISVDELLRATYSI